VDWIHRYVGIGSEISSWWVQLATALVFGLGFATLLTLVLTPVLLAAPSVWRDGWRRLRGRWRRKPATGDADKGGKNGKSGKPPSPAPLAEAAE